MNRIALKAIFQTGDPLDQSAFINLIDSLYNLDEDDKADISLGNVDNTSDAAKLAATLLAIRNGVPTAGDDLNKLYNLVVGIGQLVGDFDASSGALPTTGTGASGAIDKGDTWRISVGGTFPVGVSPNNIVKSGDILTAKINNASAASDFFTTEANADQATATVLGIVKLYTDLLASNTDGSVTQGAIVSALLLKLNLTGGTLTGALNEAKWTDIASAATVDLGTANGNYGNVTGSTGPITSLGTVASGRRVATFTGTPVLTHNATSLILPTGANITVAVGDTATFVSLGSGNWKCIGYTRANGTALAGSGGSFNPATDIVGDITASNTPIVDNDTIAVAAGKTQGQMDSIKSNNTQKFGGTGVLLHITKYDVALNITAMIKTAALAQVMYNINGGAFSTFSFPVAIAANDEVGYKIQYNSDANQTGEFTIYTTNI